jgi:hypothetical protein
VAGGGIDGEGMTEKERKGWLVKNQGGRIGFLPTLNPNFILFNVWNTSLFIWSGR